MVPVCIIFCLSDSQAQAGIEYNMNISLVKLMMMTMIRPTCKCNCNANHTLNEFIFIDWLFFFWVQTDPVNSLSFISILSFTVLNVCFFIS